MTETCFLNAPTFISTYIFLAVWGTMAYRINGCPRITLSDKISSHFKLFSKIPI
ncbi:hypothetical protein [uncultured Apibacter sp.]|uniref:hypothetical protein n=1 Tax=uncultured Apibacter sp. TaxID=1778616 RepID=UPI0025EAE759|nr:hypothetical protein [uncultured Apibacter sp.]